MDPDAFTLKPTADEVAQLGGAIRFGYQEMDRLVAAALALAGNDTTVVLCTALSQQPYVQGDDDGGKRFYRPHDIAGFATALGIHGLAGVAPVMSEQFHLLFAHDQQATAAADLLREASVAGQPAFVVRQAGTDVFTGFAPSGDLPPDATIEVAGSGASLPVVEWLYRAETPKSGYHHSQGAFWVRPPGGRPPSQRPPEEVVPLQAVAPTLLALLDLVPPATMATPPVGSVLGR